MIYPYPTPIPWWLPLLLMPEPEVLRKYGKVAYALLKTGRKRAKELGKEHRQSLKNASWR